MKNKNIDKIKLTPKDIAEYCQVSKSTVLKWIEDNNLEAFRLPSGHYRIERDDFKKFLIKWNIPVKSWLFE
jgi:excisionase family DNA binding protein